MHTDGKPESSRALCAIIEQAGPDTCSTASVEVPVETIMSGQDYAERCGRAAQVSWLSSASNCEPFSKEAEIAAGLLCAKIITTFSELIRFK